MEQKNLEMSKEKQIEEMATVIANTYLPVMQGVTTVGEICLGGGDAWRISNALYNAGYRKQSEGEWVYKFTLDGDRFYECSVCGRQEVVNCLCKERNLAEDRPYCHCGAKMKGGAE